MSEGSFRDSYCQVFFRYTTYAEITSGYGEEVERLTSDWKIVGSILAFPALVSK